MLLLVGIGQCPREHFYFGELVHTIETLGVYPAGAGLGAIASRDSDRLEWELNIIEGLVCLHPGQWNLGGACEDQLRFSLVLLGPLNGINLLLSVLISGLKATC